mgnify:CR=1 FL=1
MRASPSRNVATGAKKSDTTITSDRRPSRSAASCIARLTFDSPTPPGVRLDDVLLVDNHETVVDTAADSSGGGGWSVKRRGLYYVVAAPGRFSFQVPTAQAEQRGWTVADACANRVRFTSPARPNQMTVYSDGRLYWGEQFRALTPALRDAADLAQQHAAPAEIALPEAMGRVNRSTPVSESADMRIARMVQMGKEPITLYAGRKGGYLDDAFSYGMS